MGSTCDEKGIQNRRYSRLKTSVSSNASPKQILATYVHKSDEKNVTSKRRLKLQHQTLGQENEPQQSISERKKPVENVAIPKLAHYIVAGSSDCDRFR